MSDDVQGKGAPEIKGLNFTESGGPNNNEIPMIASALDYETHSGKSNIDSWVSDLQLDPIMTNEVTRQINKDAKSFADAEFNTINDSLNKKPKLKNFWGFDTKEGKELRASLENKIQNEILDSYRNDPNLTSSLLDGVNSWGKSMDQSIDSSDPYGIIENSTDYEDMSKDASSKIEKKIEEEIIEQQNAIAGESPEYLVKGAVLQCSKGSHFRAIDMPESHGWYRGEKALMKKDDYVGEEDDYYWLMEGIANNGWFMDILYAVPGGKQTNKEQLADFADETAGLLDPQYNIRCFGHCRSAELHTKVISEGKKKQRLDTKQFTSESVVAEKVSKTVEDYLCEPKFSDMWGNTLETVMVRRKMYSPVDADGSKYIGNDNNQLLTTGSYIFCKNGGGIITPATSGQFDPELQTNVSDSNIYDITDPRHYLKNQAILSTSLDPLTNPEEFNAAKKRDLEHVDLYFEQKKAYDACILHNQAGYSNPELEDKYTKAKQALKAFEEENGIESPFYEGKAFKGKSQEEIEAHVKATWYNGWSNAAATNPQLSESKEAQEMITTITGKSNSSMRDAKITLTENNK